MKKLCIISILLILCACRGEKKHVALVYEILKNPVMIDSICISNGYGIDIRNKSSLIDCLKQNHDMEFLDLRIIDKGYENEDLEWQILMFKKDSTAIYEFYFKKTLDNKWVLFEPKAIYD